MLWAQEGEGGEHLLQGPPGCSGQGGFQALLSGEEESREGTKAVLYVDQCQIVL